MAEKSSVPYWPKTTYLTNFLAKPVLAEFGMPGVGSLFAHWSGLTGLGLHALKYVPVVSKWARIGLVGLAAVNAKEAYDTLGQAWTFLDNIEPIAHAFIAYHAGQDAFRRD